MGDNIFKSPLNFEEMIKIHGCSWSLSSDSGLSELDQNFYKLQPPAVSYNDIKDKICDVYPGLQQPNIVEPNNENWNNTRGIYTYIF